MNTTASEPAAQTSTVARTNIADVQAGARVSPTDAVDRTDFVNAMSTAVTGVYVVTTDGTGGRFGLTVSAVSSVSADPPMVLVCINRRSPVCAAVRANDAFCVNTLSTEHRCLADIFAGKAFCGDPYDFSSGVWTKGITDAPRLIGAVSNFECQLEHAYDAGTHTVFVGRVLTAHQGGGSPLLYTHRSYGEPRQWAANH